MWWFHNFAKGYRTTTIIADDIFYFTEIKYIPTFFFWQGLQKGPGSHWAGSNGERVHSSSGWADGGSLNQVGHSAASPSNSSEPTVNHPSSPSPPSASLSTAFARTPTSVIPLTKESEHEQDSYATAVNHHSPKRTAGSPTTQSPDNPRHCAPLMGKDCLATDSRLDHVHPGARSAASSPASPLSAFSSSPHSNKPIGSFTKPDSDTVNGSAEGACSEDSQSPLTTELHEACHKASPLFRSVHPSSTVSICPSSSDILKACR